MLGEIEIADHAVSVWQLRWRRLAADRAALAGLATLIVLVVMCYGAALYEDWLGVHASATNLLDRFARRRPGGIRWGRTRAGGTWCGAVAAGRADLAVDRADRPRWEASAIGTLIGAVAGYVRGAHRHGADALHRRGDRAADAPRC